MEFTWSNTWFTTKLFALIIVASLCYTCALASNEQCIKGPYHKKSPSAENDDYKFCIPWKDLTCCTKQLDSEVDMNNSPKLYNDSWHICGNLSEHCLKFWKRQECFYQCSPYTYKWQHNTYPDAIQGVPLCANECDDWFDACKNDTICVENVLEDYNKTMNNGKVCPTSNECETYTQKYGNGKGLCEKMWGNSYKYVKANKEKDNCMVLWFAPGTENPNANVLKEVSASAFHNPILLLVFLLPVFQLLRSSI